MPDINIRGRDDGSVKLLQGLAKQAKTLDNAFIELKGSMVQLDRQGEITKGSLKGVNATGQEVTSTLKNLKKGVVAYTLTVKDNEQAVRKQTEALAAQKREEIELAKSIKAGIDASNLRRNIQRGFSQREVLAKQATPQEAFNLRRAEAAVASLVRTQKVSAAQAKLIWADVRRNIFKAYEGARGDAQRALYALARAQRAVGSSAQSEMSKTKKAIASTTKGVKDLTLSWKSLSRIVIVQTLRRALFAFTNTLRESVQEAIKLSMRIAELQTISQNAQLSTEKWSAGLKELSESFGLDILDVTEAAYQTLSNQIAEGAETFDFMSSAARFSITTLTSATDSVNLLTSALNAYGKSSEEAEYVAGTLFKTIELGRVRGSELNSTFGRIAVLASQLGISLESLEAFLAIVTIRGVKTSEAMTQMRGVFTKLLRPTKTMLELFSDLGVSSAEQLFQTRNLAEAFAELEKRTAGSSTELGKLFPRQRGITGAIIGTIAAADELPDKIKQIQEASTSYIKAQELIFQATGKVVQREIIKIKNFFTLGFGTTTTKILARVSKAIGGISGPVIALSRAIMLALIPAVAALSRVLITLVTRNPITAIVSGIVLATSLLVEGIIAVRGYLEKQQTAVKRAVEARLKSIALAESKISSLIKDSISARQKLENRLSRDIIGEINKRASAQADAIKSLAKIINSDFNVITKNLKAGLNSLVADQRDAVRRFNDLSKFEADISKTIKEQVFDMSLSRLDNIADKLALYQKEIRATEQRIIAAVTIGDDSLLRDATADLQKLTTERIRFAQKAKDERSVIAKKLTEEEAKLRLDVLKLDEQRRAAYLAKNFKRAAQYDVKERNLVFKRTREIDKLRQQLDNLRNQDIDKFADSFESQYNKILNITRLAVGQLQADQLRRALENAKKESDYRILLNRHEIAQKRFAQFEPKDIAEAETPAALRKIFQARLQNIEELLAVTKKLQSTEATVAEKKRLQNLEDLKSKVLAQEKSTIAAKTLDLAATELDAKFKALKILNEELLASRKLLRSQLVQIDALTNIDLSWVTRVLGVSGVDIRVPEISQEQLVDLKLAVKALKDYQESADPQKLRLFAAVMQKVSTIDLSGFQAAGPAVKEFVDSGQKLANMITGMSESKKNVVDIVATLAGTSVAQKNISDAMKQYQNNTVNATTKIGAQESVLIRVLRLLKEIQATTLQTQMLRAIIQGNARGGYMATSDKIPAMLSPGEFVVNAKSTRQFYSQLVGINSGHARGGQIPNTTIGDIHISVQPGGSVDSDVVRIGKQLRRQVRRGTVRLT